MSHQQGRSSNMYTVPYAPEDPMDEAEDASLSKTCHLCGKAQCGQRKGRVRCAYCKRIFCLQQLYKKFKIKASVEDTDFKCPRCLGICCCVCNCQRPPPHVHCKVYKVRQNKKRIPEEPAAPLYRALEPAITPNIIKLEIPTPELASVYAPQNTIIPIQAPQDPYLNAVVDPLANPFSMYNTDIPGIQHSDWLTQLNLQILDNGDINNNNAPSFFSTTIDNSTTDYQFNSNEKFVDVLRRYINHRQELNPVNRHQLLLDAATKLQMKAAKSDLVFKMVDSFNRNTVQVTITWKLSHLPQRTKSSLNVLPYFYVINRFYPTVLFSFETNDTKYDDQSDNRTVSITYFNTSAVKDIPSLCTCIALLDSIFRKSALVTAEEKWTEQGITWNKPENIDSRILTKMIELYDDSKKRLELSKQQCRVCISYSRSAFGMSFENLPLMCVIMKKVSVDYPSVIYSLERITCDEQRIVFMLLFNEERNWVKILNGYESNIEVCKEENYMMNRVYSQPVLLDL